MSNAQSYVRSVIALLIGVFAIQQELWLLLLVSVVLLYTAYEKFCLMFSLLGINKRLRIENYYHALLAEHIPFPSYIFDDNRHLVFSNSIAKEEFPHIHKINDLIVIHKDKNLSDIPVSQTIFEHNKKTYQLQMEGFPSEKILFVYVSDITEVLSLKLTNNALVCEVESVNNENELSLRLLAQQSKFTSTGELIETIVHQWKQPLSALNALLANIQIQIELKAVEMDTLAETVGRGTELVDIMNETVNDFKNFFKEDKTRNTFRLSDCLKNAILVLEGSLSTSGVNIINKSDPSLEVLGYKNEFTQVLINIINNAKDAIVENNPSERSITITSELQKELILVKISDTAGGIALKNLAKVFDAHFTTKNEEGTGIGLHMSKMIIEKDMKGSLSVSNNDKGAEFLIEIPIVIQ